MNDPHPLGEFGLIDWIRRHERERFHRGPRTKIAIGDDCAVLSIWPGSDLLLTTDMLMDGRHFRLEADGAEAVGYKALGVNLSDIAAMAGVPRAALLAVALPRNGAVSVAQGIYNGMRPLADRFGVELAGGDTNAWDGPLVITLTLLGEPTARGPVLRSGARAGDAVLVTGPLGGSLFSGRHLRPEPRIAEALSLHDRAEIHAMIDISDGLASDLGHILDESGGAGAVLDATAIPIHADALEASRSDGVPPLHHALNDGEDFELCLVVSAADARLLIDRPPGPARVFLVGEVTEGPGMFVRASGGALESLEPRGFDHLASQSKS
jgi:thiamine-monophosphate kinase